MKKGLGKGLGKGLDALIARDLVEEGVRESGAGVLEVDINKIVPSKEQPRKHFEQDYIEELARSIGEVGIIQPLVVKREGEAYVIVAGERRWRAAAHAGLRRVPVIVKEYSDLESLEVALIENVQRENLNPVEEANCYKRLSEEFGLTQEEISQKVGKSRSHISNLLRLLRLDAKVQELLISGKLTMGHAKAVLGIENRDIQNYFAKKIVEEGLTVREAEEFAKKYSAPQAVRPHEMMDVVTDEERARRERYTGFQMDLRGVLGTRVNIRDNRSGGSGGKIEINYFSEEDLGRIVEIMKKPRV